jgi:Skp family chaperone for outer membrane proteins
MILVIAFVFSLGLNAAVIGIASVGTVVAGIYDAVTGTTSAYTATKERALRSEREVTDLAADRTRLQSEAAALLEERDRAIRRSGELFDQVEDGKAYNARLTDDILANEARISSLEDDIRSKELRIVSLSDELGESKRKIASISDDLAQRDVRIRSLTDDVARQADTIVYRGARTSLSEAVLDTNGRIARRTATAATRNASSVVAEAIPYLGIAAMLAVTTYDLKDSCDTIKDLHALDVAIDPAKEFGEEETAVCGLGVPNKDEVWQKVKTGSEEAWISAGEYLPSLPEFSLPSWRDLKFW